MKIKEFIKPILQFIIILMIGSTIVIGTSKIVSKHATREIIVKQEPLEVILKKDLVHKPCKLTVEINRERDSEYEDEIMEYILDGIFCEIGLDGIQKSQITKGADIQSVFFEVYKLPWTNSDNFSDIEKYNLEKYK